MPRYECPVCHGTYHDPEPSGGTYFHTCPPLSVAELLTLDPAMVHGLVPELPAPFTRADVERVLMFRSVERPGARNENVIPGRTLHIFGDERPREFIPPRPIQDQPPRRRIGD